MPFGVFLDLMACYALANGAVETTQKKDIDIDEIMIPN